MDCEVSELFTRSRNRPPSPCPFPPPFCICNRPPSLLHCNRRSLSHLQPPSDYVPHQSTILALIPTRTLIQKPPKRLNQSTGPSTAATLCRPTPSKCKPRRRLPDRPSQPHQSSSAPPPAKSARARSSAALRQLIVTRLCRAQNSDSEENWRDDQWEESW